MLEATSGLLASPPMIFLLGLMAGGGRKGGWAVVTATELNSDRVVLTHSAHHERTPIANRK